MKHLAHLNQRSILITGATGSFGSHALKFLLANANPKRVIIFSRDELKQFELGQRIQDSRLRFFIGDVRDKERLLRAFHQVDYVIHAAALKQVPAIEYNPYEAIKTNILGAHNIIEAAIDSGVKKVMALSTDKAANPINLYGATKLCSDKLFVAANSLASGTKTRFSVVRYGNVIGSRGSVIPVFLKQKQAGKITITDERMTRFLITLNQGVNFVFECLDRMHGGEIFVPKIPSARILDIAKAIAPHCEIEITGIRPGEKLHEVMITEDDARLTIEYKNHYLIQPQFLWWDEKFRKSIKQQKLKKVAAGFLYASNTNTDWLTIEKIKQLVFNPTPTQTLENEIGNVTTVKPVQQNNPLQQTTYR